MTLPLATPVVPQLDDARGRHVGPRHLEPDEAAYAHGRT
jgi:hypothetical protein